MQILNVPTINGIIKETAYNIYDFPYAKLQVAPTCQKGKKGTYYNVSASFDIETTTIEPRKIEEKYIFTPYGFMYQWQFCVMNTVCFGRTWDEFVIFLDRIRIVMNLNDKTKLAVYVHNLAFEFQFMKEFIEIDNMFCKDKRKPLKVESKGIEFRCSYFLSNMSLAKFCENSSLCTHYKLDGEFDYRKVRTPSTPLNNTELSYCYNDVRGLCECIDTMLEQDTIASIPLTNTGYVRREYRQAMNSERKNRYNFQKTQLSASQYLLLRKAFRGGDTHANRFKSNTVLKNIFSYDISSSYPACIMMDDFPIGKFTNIKFTNQEKLNYFCNNYCVVMEVSFYNIRVTNNNPVPYIDIAHCKEQSKILNDNGRVLKADYIKICITNIDLEIIRSMYDFDGFEVGDAMYATKGKLPIELRNKLMEFFTAKTQLKNIDGKEYEYMKSKNRVNSTYGMMVTDFMHSVIQYNIDTMEWDEEKPTREKAIVDFYKSRNNFLSYQWGVFVTANARKRLHLMIAKVGKDHVYNDTDSIKFEDIKHVAEFNKINDELLKKAETNDIKAYVDRIDDGVTERFHLGTWDNDSNYIEFKTLGAKKYCFTKEKKGKIKFEITVSGMSKDKGSKVVKNIDNFKIGRTYNNIGRTTSWYNDIKAHKITVNGDTFTTASNIGILETSYTLGVTNEYWALINANGNNIL